ncbi:unnamed protein product [[Candida] boidinii]|nr:unnamed protein product [[Candida] boidinii]
MNLLPLKLIIHLDAKVVDLIGFVLYSVDKLDSISSDLKNTIPLKNPNHWSLYLSDDDGEIFDDFGVLNRSRDVSSYGADEFVLNVCSSEEAAKNNKITPLPAVFKSVGKPTSVSLENSNNNSTSRNGSIVETGVNNMKTKTKNNFNISTNPETFLDESLSTFKLDKNTLVTIPNQVTPTSGISLAERHHLKQPQENDYMVSPLQQYVSDDSDEEEVSIKASRRYVPGPRNASRNGNGNKGPVAGGAKGGIGGRASGLSRDLGSLSALSVSTLGSTGNESGLVQVSGGAGSGTGTKS